MGKHIFITIAVIIFFNSANLAQNNPKNIIKTNPFVPIVSIYSLQFERVIDKNHSLQIAGYFMNSTPFDLFSGGPITGFCITPELRFYTSRKRSAPNGFYIAPFYHYYNAVVNANPSDWAPQNVSGTYRLISQGPGISFGYQFIIAHKFSIDMFAGPAYYDASNSEFKPLGVKGWTRFPVGGLTGRTGFTLGFAF